MLLNCGVGEDSWESLGLQGDPTSPLEGLMLKLKLQYFGHLIWRADSFEKTLMLGKIEGRRRRGNRGWDGWMASPTRRTCVWVYFGSWWWTGRPGVLWFMGSQIVRHNWATELIKINWEFQINISFTWLYFNISYIAPFLSKLIPLYFSYTLETTRL